MKKQDSYFTKHDIQDHAKNPCNFGLKPGADFVSDQYNPSCGDMVVVGGFIRDGKMVEMFFEGKGCMLSIAMASKLSQWVKDRPVEDILGLDESIVSDLLGMQLGPNRLLCGLLVVNALFKGLKAFLDHKKTA